MNNLTDKEFIDRMYLLSTDPVVLRLIGIINNNKFDSVVDDLVNVGMDPTEMQFSSDYGWDSPGEYIRHLREDVEFLTEEINDKERRINDLQHKVKDLSARGVATLLAEMQQLVRDAEVDKKEAKRRADSLFEENSDLRQKLGMWNIVKS
jgi:hypothetical protein